MFESCGAYDLSGRGRRPSILAKTWPRPNTGSNVCRANYFSYGTRFMAYRAVDIPARSWQLSPEPKTVTGLYHLWYLTLAGKI